MLTCRSLLLLACLTLLPGCLQVELYGPVAGATVTITPLQGGTALVKNLKTTDVGAVKSDIGTTQWDALNNDGKAAYLGVVEIPELALVPTQYYLVTASGGIDTDGDANGIVDGAGTVVERQVRAIMSGAQLKRPFNRVTMLSEAIYRYLEPELGDLSNAEVGQRLNAIARKMVGDINSDKRVNYNDVLQWSHFFGKKRYKGPADFLARMPRAIHSTTYSDDIVTYDSFNLVENASFKPNDSDEFWKNDLIGCVFPVVYGDLCTMRTLPLIGLDTNRPEVSDVMSRLVSSEPWIADRFEELLYAMPDDILLLFRSVTAVVIGTEIRPSYYDSGVGTLNLDADFFWLNPEERRSVSTEPDYRAEFANEVNFAHQWRYVEDSEDVFEQLYRASESGQRELADIELNVASLLLHELAHAADYVRPQFLRNVPRFANMYQLSFQQVSDDLQGYSPLQSDILASIANVLFYGASATPQEAKYTAAKIGTFFEPDPASDLYSYSSQYEDVAMLFEEAMMEILYGVQRDVAFTSVPGPADEGFCDSYRVGWGMRGRIASSKILPRAKFVVAALLPERNYAPQLDKLKKPSLLNTSKDWCDSVQLNGNPNFAPYVQLRKAMPPRDKHARRFL